MAMVAKPVEDSSVPVVAASVAQVAKIALRTGLGLWLVTAGLGTCVLVGQRGSIALIAQGVAMVVLALVLMVKVEFAMRMLRAPGAIVGLVAAFCAVGALEHGLQPAYSSVLFALVWIAGVIASPLIVAACALTAAAGFALDVAAEGHALQAEHGSVAAQSIGELAILLVSAGMTSAAVGILRSTLAGAPGVLVRVRAGSQDSLTPALAQAVRGEPIALLPRADAAAIVGLLSPAERKVLTLLASGLAPKQVARELGVALATVRSHIASGKRKTGSRTLEQLVGIFVESQGQR